MKLYMRQHVFTIGDRFNVWDEDGHDRWFVEQELLTWGKILRVYDLSGREAASIHQEVLTFRPRSVVADFSLLPQTVEAALRGEQLQPILL